MTESLVSLRGWLRQKMPVLRFDKHWFCVVTDDRVDLFQKEDAPTPSESFTTDEIEEVKSVASYSLPAFQVRLRNSQVKTFLCTNIEECERWICALTNTLSKEAVSIDSFELISVIGRGAFGKVFLAKKKGTEDLYAIKAIRKDMLTQHARESRIIAERNILMRAAHQFVTRLFYAFQTPEKFYFVLEYVAGGDLQHHLHAEVDFSPYQIRLYLAEIIIALRNLHRLGIIYRDLKPENILLDTRGHIKLADFGLSRVIDKADAQKFSMCGTSEYLPPEMIRDQPQTFCVDWWALGVLAFRLIVGHLPFQSYNKGRLFDLICNAEPRIPPCVDPDAASFIRALLKKNPAERLGGIGTDITAHKYFEGISWADVARMEYKPEFSPFISRPDSVSNFNREFTEEPVVDSYVDRPQFTVKDFSVENMGEITRIVSFDDGLEEITKVV